MPCRCTFAEWLVAAGVAAWALFPNTQCRAEEEGPATPLVDYYDGMRAWDMGEREIAIGTWTAAARLGDQRSIRKLGELFEQGADIPPDKAIAYFWFSVSSRMGNEASKADVARIASGLSPEEVSGLDEEVARWQPGPGPVNREAWPTDLAVPAAVSSIDSGDAESLLSAIEGGALPDAAPEGKPLIFRAVATGRNDLVEALLSRGARIDGMLGSGVTLLHVAAASGDMAVARTLVARGAPAMIQDDNGATPGEVAARAGHHELASFLEEAFREEASAFEGYLVKRGYIDPGGLLDPVVRDRAVRMFQKGIPKQLIPSGRLNLQTRIAAREAAADDRPVNFIFVVRYESDESYHVLRGRDASASVEQVRGRAQEVCSEKGGRKCKFNYAPSGGCIAVAAPPAGEFLVSTLQFDSEKAQEDALDLCEARHSSGCEIWISECAWPREDWE